MCWREIARKWMFTSQIFSLYDALGSVWIFNDAQDAFSLTSPSPSGTMDMPLVRD